jgi:hypothetical protein
MAGHRKSGMKAQRHENLPKLQPGDKVPKTGLYRLDDGVRIKPVRSKNRKSAKMRKIKTLGRSRGR